MNQELNINTDEETWRQHTNKVIAEQQLNNICKLLNATRVDQITLDSRGKTSKRIILTYDNDDSSNLQQRESGE